MKALAAFAEDPVLLKEPICMPMVHTHIYSGKHSHVKSKQKSAEWARNRLSG